MSTDVPDLPLSFLLFTELLIDHLFGIGSSIALPRTLISIVSKDFSKSF